ncbi:hypothetical protein ERAN111884_06765 [Erysipelothrix anatis]
MIISGCGKKEKYIEETVQSDDGGIIALIATKDKKELVNAQYSKESIVEGKVSSDAKPLNYYRFENLDGGEKSGSIINHRDIEEVVYTILTHTEQDRRGVNHCVISTSKGKTTYEFGADGSNDKCDSGDLELIEILKDNFSKFQKEVGMNEDKMNVRFKEMVEEYASKLK